MVSWGGLGAGGVPAGTLSACVSLLIVSWRLDNM